MATVEEAIKFVNKREKPLAVYVFSTDYKLTEQVSSGTSSGGISVNDTIMQAAVPSLPFGGVGHSGMGRYHGKASFDVFSNVKSYFYRNQMMESMNSLRYPPYDSNASALKWFEWLVTPNV